MNAKDILCGTPEFSKQLKTISAVFCLIAGLFVLRLCTTAVIKADERKKTIEKLRVASTLHIPGCRGRILDRQGNILAWTERQMQIIWHVPENYNQAEFDWMSLIRFNTFAPTLPHITRLSDYLGQDIVLCTNQPFSTPDIWNAIQLVRENLECRASFKRHITKPELQEMIGSTTINPETNIEEGVSGLEQEFDHKLRPGLFEIRLLNNSYRAILMNAKGDGEDIWLNAVYFF